MNKAAWFGTEVIANHGDVEREYRAVRESAGVIDLSWRGKIRLVGPDRQKWLQGQVSNDVVKLEPGKGHETCVLEVKGHILAFLKLYNSGDYLLADINPDICATIIQTLDFYRIMEKVEIQNATEELGLVGIYGPDSFRLLSNSFGAWRPVDEYDCSELDVQGDRWLVVNSRLTGEDGYDVYTSRQKAPILIQRLIESGAVPIGIDALNILRVEAGRPWQPFEISEKVFPQEATIENRAVSFTKGCFIGQETIARIHSRGHVNRKLARLTFAGDVLPNAGDHLLALDSEREVGHVTSAVRSPDRGLIGLGFVRREYLQSETQLAVQSDGQRISATIGVTDRF